MSAIRPETALRSILLESAEVTAHIGDRLTRSVALQTSPYPFGIFARTKTEPHYTMGGRSDLREVDVMFAWYHTDFDALAALVESVETSLSGFSGRSLLRPTASRLTPSISRTRRTVTP